MADREWTTIEKKLIAAIKKARLAIPGMDQSDDGIESGISETDNILYDVLKDVGAAEDFMPEHEYAFDVKLCGVVRLKAINECEARKKISAFQAVDISRSCGDVMLTEASVYRCDQKAFEIDGKEIAQL